MRHIVLALRALVLGRWVCKYRLSLHFSEYNLVWWVHTMYSGSTGERESGGRLRQAVDSFSLNWKFV